MSDVPTTSSPVGSGSEPRDVLHPFQYKPLDEGDIRILQLLPGKRLSRISCNLIHRKLSDCPEYDALSYCWGAEDASRAITVDGMSFLVTPNLHEALLEFRAEISRNESGVAQLRGNLKLQTLYSTARSWFKQSTLSPSNPSPSNPTLSIWIDTICINQKDDDERASQVLLMGKLYQSSARLKIWLGPRDPDSGIVRDFLRFLDASNPVTVSDIDSMMRMKSDKDWKRVLKATTRLCSNGWFFRAWIVQEFVLTAFLDTDIYWGDTKFTETELFGLKRFITEEKGNFLSDMNGRGFPDISYLRILIDWHASWTILTSGRRQYAKERIPSSLLFWLILNRRAKASNGRDKLYI